MNTIAKILLYLVKILNYWFLVIPMKMSLFAFIGYNLIILGVFGAIDMGVVKDALDLSNINHAWFNILIGFPYFISFYSMFAGANTSTGGLTSSLDRAIDYRNGQMSVKSDKDAFELYKKTANLDVMKANQGSHAYSKAIKGFNATSGNDSPQKVLKDYLK